MVGLTLLDWGITLNGNVEFFILYLAAQRSSKNPDNFEIFYFQILRNNSDKETRGRALLFKVIPYLPASLPTLLFCRITELTIYVEGNDIVEYEMWEEMVSNRYKLIDMANDIKIIGKFWVPIRYNCPKKQFLCLPSLYTLSSLFVLYLRV